MSPVLNAPIDQTHRDCLTARAEIRRMAELFRYHVSLWKPAPMPASYRKENTK